MSNQYEGTRKRVKIVDQRVEVWQDFFGKDSFPPAQEEGAAAKYAGCLDGVIKSRITVDKILSEVRGKGYVECCDDESCYV